jgi:hypothetical protein
MTIDELLTELTFHGSQCTKDCSGHRAGWKWGKAHPNVATTNSASHPSFNNGVRIANANSKVVMMPGVRGAGGRFVKFTPEPKPSKRNKP